MQYVKLDITGNLGALKRFLSIRDASEAFDPVRARAGVGIPVLVKNDGEEIRFDVMDIDTSALPKKKQRRGGDE